MPRQRFKLPGSGLLSYSGMSMFLGCPRKYAYRYIDRVERAETDTSAMDRGSAFHLLVETNGEASQEQVSEDLKENPYEVAKVVTAYRAYHKYEADGLLPKMNHSEVKIVSDEHQFIGYVDMIGVQKDDRWMLGELKTTSRFDPVKWATLSINTQIALYCEMSSEFAHDEFLEMNDFQGVSYRTVELSSKRPLKATKKRTQGETPDEYGQRIANDTKIFHQMVSPSEEARLSALQCFSTVKEAVHNLRGRSGHAVKNPGNCYAYNRPCEYFEHCWKIKPHSDEDIEDKVEFDI